MKCNNIRIIIRMNRLVYGNKYNNNLNNQIYNNNIMNQISFILDNKIIMMSNRINRVEYNNYRDNMNYY